MTTHVHIVGPTPPKTDPLAIWSLILGILSTVCLGPLAAIPAVICGHIARSKIKSSTDPLGGRGMALAGLILGYVGIAVFILAIFIGIAMAITLPSFLHAKDKAQTMICISNLKQIESAKDIWARAHSNQAGGVPSSSELDPYIPDGFHSLECPKHGDYTIYSCGQPPECSVTGHTLGQEDPPAPPDLP